MSDGAALLERLLNQVASELDIPSGLAKAAEGEYTRLATWLNSRDIEQGRREPKVYPQGSFRLGTAVRPIAGEYDVDLVYERDLRQVSVTRARLKEEAGESLASYVEHARASGGMIPQLADEGKRCWTLDYPGQFHMDILPAIPDDDSRQYGKSKSAILITDREDSEWQSSDPVAYGQWFRSRSLVAIQREKREMARRALIKEGVFPTEETIKASAERIPEFDVKTTLQRAVQILKRHRDVFFPDDDPDRPASIILTTLAARAYRNESGLVETLRTLVREMPRYIEKRTEGGVAVSWVPNPVHAAENFADRWRENGHSGRETKFRQWLERADEQLTLLLSKESGHAIVDLLGGSLGNSLVEASARSLGMLAKEASGANSPLVLEDDSHVHPLMWPMALGSKVSVAAGVYAHKYGSKMLWKLGRRAVPKDLAIRFQAETNSRRPYEVYWQVVNTGSDARFHDALRGEIERGDVASPEVRWETTQYVGVHWVEAFVVKEGWCVARSGPVYVRIKG